MQKEEGAFGSIQWHGEASRKKIDHEKFDHLPPLETILPDELKNYTRQQLKWYLEQRGVEPEETKPKMKAQLREILKEIQGDQPPSEETRQRVLQAHRATTFHSHTPSTATTTSTLSTPSNHPTVNITAVKNVKPIQLMAQLSAPLKTQSLPPRTKLVISKANKNARPFVDIIIKADENIKHQAKYREKSNLLHMNHLFHQEEPQKQTNGVPTCLGITYVELQGDISASQQRRISFLKSLLVPPELPTDIPPRKTITQL